MGIPMIVKKPFRPGGSASPLLKAGSPFEASGKQQAQLCRTMGWCEDAPASAAPVAASTGAAGAPYESFPEAGSYFTRAKAAAKKVAAKKTASASSATVSKSGGTYSRRDMTAEE